MTEIVSNYLIFKVLVGAYSAAFNPKIISYNHCLLFLCYIDLKMDYVALIKQGDQAVFEVVYHKYHDRIYYFVLKTTSSEDLSEEVVQMSFIRLWEKRRQLSDKYPIEVQLARTARSIMVDLLRSKATERIVLRVVQETTDAVIGGDPLVSKQLLEKTTETINSLPPECQKIFKLSREEGLSHKEIAQRLSISPKTVENQISKALKVVRKAVVLSCILMLL